MTEKREDEQAKSVLSSERGHHCGAKDKRIGHCGCPECHDTVVISGSQ